MSLLTNWRSRWPSDFAMEPEQVYRDKEAERAGQLVEQASQEKYGTPDPSFSFSHLSDFVAQAGESAGRRAGLPQYSEANPPPWAEGAASHAPQAAPNITAGDITSGRWQGPVGDYLKAEVTAIGKALNAPYEASRTLSNIVLGQGGTDKGVETGADGQPIRHGGGLSGVLEGWKGQLTQSPLETWQRASEAGAQADRSIQQRGIGGINPQILGQPVFSTVERTLGDPLLATGGGEALGVKGLLKLGGSALVGSLASGYANDKLPQDMNPVLRTGLVIGAGGIGGIVAHNPSAVLRLGEGGPVTGAPLRILNKLTGGGFGGSTTYEVKPGDPLYHGSPNPIDGPLRASEGHQTLGKGTYLTNNAEHAGDYATEPMRALGDVIPNIAEVTPRRALHLLEADSPVTADEASRINVVLSLRGRDAVVREGMSGAEAAAELSRTTGQADQILQAAGFDGINAAGATGQIGRHEAVVFDPSLIEPRVNQQARQRLLRGDEATTNVLGPVAGGSVTEDVSGGGLHAPGAGGKIPADLPDVPTQAARDLASSEQAMLPIRSTERGQFQGQNFNAYRNEADRVLNAGGTPEEAHAAGKAAMAGRAADFTAGEFTIDPSNVPALRDIATREWQSGHINDAVHLRVQDKLTEIEAGNQRLQGHQVADFEKTFGKNAVEEAGINSRGATINPDAPATTMPMDLGAETKPAEPPLFGDSGVSAPEHGKMAAPVDVFQPGDPIRTPGVSDARPGAEDLTFADPVRTRLRAELGPVKPDPVPLAKAQSAPQRLWTHIADVLNLPMSLRAGIDLSGTLRQGLALGMGNPREGIQAFRTEIKALLSQKNLEDAQRAIREHPDYQLLKASKVHLAMDQVGNGAREEVLASHLPEKIPTWLGGGMIRGGERAYTGFLDTLRANVFYKTLDNMVAREAAGGAPVTIEGRGGLKAVGDVINHGSGRGTGRFLDQVGGFQVHPLFSPRNFLSRPQLISDLATKSGAARGQAIRQVIGLGGTVVAFDTLVQLTGQGVGINPLGGDFGRARIGNSSIDLSGGLAGTIRTGAQLATGMRSVGKGYEDANRMDTLMRFGRGKLSPTFAFVVDNLKGSDYNNAPVDWTALTGPGSAGAELANLGVPMIIPDIITAAKAELGPDTTPEQALTFFAIAAGSILGAGTQSGLSPSESLQEARDAATSKLFPGQKYDDLAGSDKAKVNQDSGVQQMNRAVQESPSSKSGKFNLEFDEEMQRAKNAFTTAGPDGQPQVTDGVGYRHAWQDALKSRNDKLHGAGLDKGGQDSVVNGWYDLYDKPGIQEQLLKKDYSGLDQLQAEYTAAHPEIVDKLAKSVGAHDDAIAQEMRQAAAQAKQYYAIPKYRGLDEATANRADAIIAAASSMTTNGQAASRDDALGKMLRNGKAVNGKPVTMEDITNVRRATTLGTNPERKAFQADPANHWFAVFYKGADETAGDVGPSLTGGSSTLPSLPSLPGGSSSSGGGFRRAGPTPVSPIRR